MQRPRLWLLALLAVFLWGGEMLRRDLWAPDEARYAYVAGEMRAGGHWLVPHRSGEFYAHKPPLLFWLINAASFLTGLPIGRVTARLPGFLAGLATLWMTARLAERWRGPPAAWPAVLVLCTNYLVWHEIGFGRIDGLLLGLTTAALYLLVRNDDAPGLWRPAAAYACMGLGILAKGPVGFFIPAGAYATLRWAGGEGRSLKKSHWLWGPLITLAFPAAWLGLAWWRGAPEGYFHELLYQQNIERVAGELGHEKPWYYFLTTVPADMLPWTFLLPAAFLVLRRDPDAAAFRRRLLGWALFVIVFFTLSHSKRNIYVLGAFPALAILIGGAWESMARAPGRWVRVGVYAFLGLFLFAGIGCLAAGLYPRVADSGRLPVALGHRRTGRRGLDDIGTAAARHRHAPLLWHGRDHAGNPVDGGDLGLSRRQPAEDARLAGSRRAGKNRAGPAAADLPDQRGNPGPLCPTPRARLPVRRRTGRRHAPRAARHRGLRGAGLGIRSPIACAFPARPIRSGWAANG